MRKMADVLTHGAIMSVGVCLLASQQVQAAGYPTFPCRSGFQAIAGRFCITNVQNAQNFPTATVVCKNAKSTVASYEDLFFLYRQTSLDANFNVNGKWIGNITGDDQVLCGNRDITSDGDTDISNFETTCDKNDVRSFWCAHDLE